MYQRGRERDMGQKEREDDEWRVAIKDDTLLRSFFFCGKEKKKIKIKINKKTKQTNLIRRDDDGWVQKRIQYVLQ